MLIKIEHLRKEYDAGTPLKDLSCEINRGDVISIIGPSGTGKSTLLNLINRLEEPTSGRIWFDGEDTTAPGVDLNRFRRRVGMVFQSFNLFSHLTVAENAMLAPVELLGLSRQEAYDRVMELLNSVGLADRALSYPSELSGGQQQRVAIVRALAMEPEVVLFDEPTSALDPTMVGEVQAVIKNLAKKGLTMLIVTHEMKFARDVANRVFYLDEGGIYEDGTPEQVFDHPQKEKTRQFIQRLKVFRYRVASDGFDFMEMNTAIESFAYRHMMEPRLTRKLLAVAEELGVQIVLRENKKFTSMDISVEYSEEKNEVQVNISFPDVGFDPLRDGNDISLAIVRNAVKSIRYAVEDGIARVDATL